MPKTVVGPFNLIEGPACMRNYDLDAIVPGDAIGASNVTKSNTIMLTTKINLSAIQTLSINYSE